MKIGEMWEKKNGSIFLDDYDQSFSGKIIIKRIENNWISYFPIEDQRGEHNDAHAYCLSPECFVQYYKKVYHVSIS